MTETLPRRSSAQDRQNRRPPLRIGLVLNIFSLLIAVVPIAVVVLIALNLFSQQAQEQAENQLTSIALLKSREIDRWLQTSATTLDLVLTNPEQRRDMIDILGTPGRTGRIGDSVTNFLLGQLSMQTAFDELYLYNLDGIVRVSTDPEQVGADLIEQGQPYVEDSLNVELAEDEEFIPPMIHPAYYDAIQGEINIIVTQPVLVETTGDVIGMMAGHLNMASLAEIMTTRDGLGETGETYLVSQEFSNFITPSRFEPYDPTTSYTSTGIERGLSGRTEPEAMVYDSYRGQRVFGVARWLPALEATLIAEVEENEALSAVRDVRNLSIVVAVVTSIIVLAIGQGITLWITRPIGKLTEIAGALMRGDYSRRANLTQRNEIGQLGQAFDTMTTELVQAINDRNVRIKQIEELSETLESRVENRTRDLRIAALVASQITTVLDLNEMLRQVVSLTVMSFDFYVCQVFSYDEAARKLVLASGVDAEGHEIKTTDENIIPLDATPSIVAVAARAGETTIVNDVRISDDYLPYSELPDSRAELAIPLRLGDRLLGIFDLQSREADRFGEEEISVLTTLAEQISVAMRNAQLFAEVEAARAEAEQANQVKSQFLANMSHELRTPLNAILNFTEFVADGVLGPVNQEQEDALNKVITSSEHLLSLINDILDLTKIEVGMMELFIEGVDVAATLESVLATAKGLVAENPDLKIKTTIEDGIPIIQADKRRIRQIMLNLISNAIKFTPEGSISITLRQENGDILLAVQDTGIGISQEEQALIFESFRQATGGRAAEAGTGLGLPITRHLVEAHGGQMWLESEINAGSTFYVRLPLRELETPAG